MKKVFFLEDDDTVAEVTIRLMEASGVQADFTRARDLGEAIRIIAECGRGFQFDVAFLDYQLPDGYGTTLMEAMRKFYPVCRICVYSALIDVDPDATRIIRRYAPDVTLAKPFSKENLKQELLDLGLL